MLSIRTVFLCLTNMLRRCFASFFFFRKENRDECGKREKREKREKKGKLWQASVRSSYDIFAVGIVSLADEVTLQSLVALYDDETYAHSQRIAYLAEAIARYLRFSDEEIALTYLAALLHDIGKIGVPRAILTKREPLSDEEWKIMRLHAQIGQDILFRAGGIFERLAPIVVAHHERWDGQGYPWGLAKDEIPMIARILAVVDSYDAMISARTYQQSSPVTRAYEELQCCAGSQYDPRVVAAFFCMYGERNEPATVLSFSPLSSFKTRTSPL